MKPPSRPATSSPDSKEEVEACIVEGQAQSVMCSYNSINGVPTCGDEQLLNGILREQWGFEGFVVSVRACGVQRWRDHESTALTVV